MLLVLWMLTPSVVIMSNVAIAPTPTMMPTTSRRRLTTVVVTLVPNATMTSVIILAMPIEFTTSQIHLD